jgi:DnaK suppressor protein
MKPHEFDLYRTKLLATKEKLAAQLEDTEHKVSFGTDTEDLEEEIDKDEEQVNRESIRASLASQLMRVNAALDKIERGRYGTCEQCGNTIDAELLIADPESVLCRSCKQAAAS